MAIINPGASLRVLPQAPTINPRDFAPDADGLLRAQEVGLKIGKEISDLSLAGERLKVEKAKLKATEEELKFNQSLSQVKMRQAIADAQGAENKLDPMKALDASLLQAGVDPAVYGANRERKLQDVQRVQQRNLAFQNDPTLTPEMLRQRFGVTLAEEMSGAGALEELSVTPEAPAPAGAELSLVQVAPQVQVPQGAAAPTQSLASAGVVEDTLAQFDDLKSFRANLVAPGTSPRRVAETLYSRDFPMRPLGSMSSAEQTAALKPYLDAAQSEVISRT